jgi:hypothetical protein
MSIPSWRVVGVSVQGTAHQKNETPCQDAHDYRLLPEGWLLAAVADGAGTANRSAEGATLAVGQILGAASNALHSHSLDTEEGWHALLADAFQQTRQSLIQLAQDEDLSPQIFATTLTCAIAGPQWLAVGQIGDGVAVAQAKGDELFAALEPQRGEYANETAFLTMDDALDHVEIRVINQPVRALALMTDGLIRLAMNVPQHSPHPPFFEPLLAFAAQTTNSNEAQAQLTTFLASERVCARTDDDKTLVLAVRHEPAPPGG